MDEKWIQRSHMLMVIENQLGGGYLRYKGFLFKELIGEGIEI